ncbi:hypothetical protein [Paenibacillus sp. Marseille-Q4541]|uniref:hypothetical protein n=1 Tax=Paenibacillus sp. Marseille-Q4541 TaxID=2831522 RepID=UPI001BA51F83|nr:hypothetical protein [Paenibacillus sp. Marseille-Q4541]
MMKKMVAAFIAGALMMVSVQAFGSGVNLIGKKIDGQADLKIDGKVVGQTIIVQGKSYAPVREIADGVGGTAKYNKSGGAVEMSLPTQTETGQGSEGSGSTNGTDLSAKAAHEQKILDKKTEIDNKKMSIENQGKHIKDIKSELENQKIMLEEYRVKAEKSQGSISSAQTIYEVTKKTVADTETRLSEAEKELLVMQQQLTDLQTQLATLEG